MHTYMTRVEKERYIVTYCIIANIRIITESHSDFICYAPVIKPVSIEENVLPSFIFLPCLIESEQILVPQTYL